MKRISVILSFAIIALSLLACSISVNLDNPTATPAVEKPVATIAPEPTLVPSLPTVAIILPTDTPMITVALYFMNEDRFAVGTEPYEDAVTRYVPADSDLPRAVLDLYFAGPTQTEVSQGMRPYTSGFTHVRNLTIENGIARVYLGGVCANNGAAYSVAALIMKNLSQFPQITAVKIYDENDSNLDPDSTSSSLPYCLEP